MIGFSIWKAKHVVIHGGIEQVATHELTHDVSAIVYLPGSIQARAFKIPSLHLIAQ